MRLFAVVVCLATLLGCAAVKQGISDYNTGKSTPLVNGEVSPAAQGQVIQNTVTALPVPFAGPIALGVGFLATVFFTWQRGASIRKNGGAPVATAAQSSIATNGTLQDVANIFTGMFTTASNASASTTGSVLQRIWKVGLATLAAGVSFAATNSDIMAFLASHPFFDAGFLAISSGLAGLEKAFSTIPVSSPAPTAPTVTT